MSWTTTKGWMCNCACVCDGELICSFFSENVGGAIEVQSLCKS